MNSQIGICKKCWRFIKLKKDGTCYRHGYTRTRNKYGLILTDKQDACYGSGQPPRRIVWLPMKSDGGKSNVSSLILNTSAKENNESI